MNAHTIIPTITGTAAGITTAAADAAGAAAELRTAAISFTAALLTAIACRIIDRYKLPTSSTRTKRRRFYHRPQVNHHTDNPTRSPESKPRPGQRPRRPRR